MTLTGVSAFTYTPGVDDPTLKSLAESIANKFGVTAEQVTVTLFISRRRILATDLKVNYSIIFDVDCEISEAESCSDESVAAATKAQFDQKTAALTTAATDGELAADIKTAVNSKLAEIAVNPSLASADEKAALEAVSAAAITTTLAVPLYDAGSMTVTTETTEIVDRTSAPTATPWFKEDENQYYMIGGGAAVVLGVALVTVMKRKSKGGDQHDFNPNSAGNVNTGDAMVGGAIAKAEPNLVKLGSFEQDDFL